MDSSGDRSPSKTAETSSPSKVLGGDDLIFGGLGLQLVPPGNGETTTALKNPIASESSKFEEDLMREFDQKASELSTFLDESNPISGSGGNTLDLLSSSPLDRSSESSPNPPVLGANSAFQTDPLMMGDTSRITEELISAAKDFGKESPTALDLGFEQIDSSKLPKGTSELGNFLMDQVVPPDAKGTSAGQEIGVDFHHTQSEPTMMHHFQQGVELNQDKQGLLESPVLPSQPCLSPDPFSIGKVSKSAPEVGAEPEYPKYPMQEDIMYLGGDSPRKFEAPHPPASAMHTKLDDYTRRETMTFEPDEDDDSLSSPRKDKSASQVLEADSLSLEHEHKIREVDEDIPPPIPKHSYELDQQVPPPVPAHQKEEEEDMPPPVPKHADNSGVILGKQEPPFVHATYDDKIDDEFEEDSLSKQLSHKLSDSLEVLKDSPQKESQLDESLMDLDELPESTSKSLSPNEATKNLLGDFGSSEPMPISSISAEMKESGIFSQVPPKELSEVSEDPFDFKSSVGELEGSRPVASIQPFSSAGNSYADNEGGGYDSLLGANSSFTDSCMTNSMIMNTSLDEIQPPKFYESEDSSASKEVVPDIGALGGITSSGGGGQDTDKDEFFEDLLPHDKNTVFIQDDQPMKMETFSPLSSTTSSSFSTTPKVDVAEVKPTQVKTDAQDLDGDDIKKEPTPQKETIAVAKPMPKQKVQVFYDDAEISEEVQQILNIFNPRAWFDPAKLHPTVGELVYWRDPKKSGAVFGAIFVVLIALTFLSLISVVAYTSLAVLAGTFGFRIYKAVLQAIQKTNDGHPFKDILELDITFTAEKAQELSNAIVNYGNTSILQLRRLFLVEDFVDSAKFGAFLYFLTYIGGWFNGLTLIILGFIAMFSLPKVYETNKVVIDQYLDLVWGKISEINAKVTAAVPFLKKDKAQ